jgi:hypothetical protein
MHYFFPWKKVAKKFSYFCNLKNNSAYKTIAQEAKIGACWSPCSLDISAPLCPTVTARWIQRIRFKWRVSIPVKRMHFLRFTYLHSVHLWLPHHRGSMLWSQYSAIGVFLQNQSYDLFPSAFGLTKQPIYDEMGTLPKGMFSLKRTA